MALYVQKYGGTSVGTLERIEAVAERVQLTRAQGHDVVVVVSAMSGETNRLLGMAQQLDQDANRREMDVLISPVSRSPLHCWRLRSTSAVAPQSR